MAISRNELLRASPELRLALVHERARTNLPAFMQLSMPIVAPAATFVPAWFYDAIAWKIECMMAGESSWVGIALPPRCGKSILTSVVLPAFLLGHNPTLGVMCVSHSRQLASKFSNDFRRLVAPRSIKSYSRTCASIAGRTTRRRR